MFIFKLKYENSDYLLQSLCFNLLYLEILNIKLSHLFKYKKVCGYYIFF